MLRRELARLGRYQVPAEDLDGLVIDACMEVASLARSWDPDRGAAPWTWAQRRLARLASGYVGIHADPLPEAMPEGRAVGLADGVRSIVDPTRSTVLEAARPGTSSASFCSTRWSGSARLAIGRSCSRCGSRPAWAIRPPP